jgi:dolichol-phosphate mannosyltransferase
MPFYNEESVIPLLRPEVEAFALEVCSELEIILVNDGSRDNTLNLLVNWAKEDDRIKVLDLSRNFGHQIAATAGLDFATGNAVVLIDADLQDPLHVIHEMVERYQEGYDVVYGQRRTRAGESQFKRFTAWAFYRLMRAIVYKDLPVDTGDFRLVSRTCLDGLRRMRETHRFLRGMVTWVGYPQTPVTYDRNERVAGQSKYPLRKMLSFAWTAATSFSTLPLKFNLLTGVLVGLFAFEETLRALIAHAMGRTVSGWTSLMVLTSVIGSSLLIGLAIIGEYLGKLYEQSKDRPLYLIARTFNKENSERAEQDITVVQSHATNAGH